MKSSRKSWGFTLVEMLLYLGIVAMMVSSMVAVGETVISSGEKSYYQQEMGSEAREISERIVTEIRRASGITAVTATSLSLTDFSPDTTTVIDLANGKIRINQNGAGVINLNSDRVSVTGLTFTNNSSADNKTKNVSFTLALGSAYTGSSQIYQTSVTVNGSAEVRSN